MTQDDESRRLEEAGLWSCSGRPAAWFASLTDLGGRNTPCTTRTAGGHARPGAADPDALDRFTQQGSIRLTRLFMTLTCAPTRSGG